MAGAKAKEKAHQLEIHLRCLGSSARLKSPSKSKTCRKLWPSRLNRSGTDRVGSSAQFSLVGQKSTERKTEKAKETQAIFRSTGPQSSCDDLPFAMALTATFESNKRAVLPPPLKAAALTVRNALEVSKILM